MTAREAIQNMIENLKNGNFKISILDDGEPRGVTAETIANLERILEND